MKGVHYQRLSTDLFEVSGIHGAHHSLGAVWQKGGESKRPVRKVQLIGGGHGAIVPLEATRSWKFILGKRTGFKASP